MKFLDHPWTAFSLSVVLLASLYANPQEHTFANPPMLYSQDGHLHVDLVAASASYTIAGHQFHGMLYNGQYMAPVWRLRSGDKLTVTLHNKLTQETNLHFHGLGVSPLKNGDNVFVHIRPGETFNYEIEIPERHVGLFWYHPHLHGDVDQQIIGGLSGGIIVEGSDRLYPFLKQLTERMLLLKHHPVGRADYQELVTVNGIGEPIIPIQPGEAQFWQIGNIGADRFLRVRIGGMPFYVIGRDGYFVPRPIRMDDVLLGPGQRVSAIVVGGVAGRHEFKSVAFTFDQRQPPLPEVNLGMVVSERPPADIGAAETKVASQNVNGPLYVESARSSPIAHQRTFTFSASADKTKFFINRKVFDDGEPGRHRGMDNSQ